MCKYRWKTEDIVSVESPDGKWKIEFENGSKIEGIESKDSTRGSKSNFIYPDKTKCIQDYLPEVECELFDISLQSIICKECWDKYWK